MKIITIAGYTIIRTVRDFKSLIIMVGLPLLLIIILGSALDTQFEMDKLEPFSVIYINKDNKEVGKQFTKFIHGEHSKEIKDILMVKDFDDLEEAKKILNRGKADFIVMLDENYSNNVLKGKEAKIIIYEKGNSIEKSVIENIINSFNSYGNLSIATGQVSSEVGQNNFIDEQPISANKKIPTAIDYYAVTMLVLIIMYGSLYAVYGFAEDYIDGMRNRLLTTPIRVWEHFTGKIFGVIFAIFLQILVLVVFTKYVYSVNWGDKILDIIIIAFTLSTFSVTFGMLFTMIIKNKDKAAMFLQVLIPIMTFMAGGYAKFEFESEFINNLRFFIPSRLGQSAFFNSIYGSYSGEVFSSIGTLWIMTIVFGVIAIIFGRRKLA